MFKIRTSKKKYLIHNKKIQNKKIKYVKIFNNKKIIKYNIRLLMTNCHKKLFKMQKIKIKSLKFKNNNEYLIKKINNSFL